MIKDVGFEAFIFIFKFFVCLIGVGWDFFNPFKRDVKTRFRCIYITYIYIKTVIYLCHFNLFWMSVFWIQQGGRLRTNERNHPQSAASFIGEKLHLNWINLILFVFFFYWILSFLLTVKAISVSLHYWKIALELKSKLVWLFYFLFFSKRITIKGINF